MKFFDFIEEELQEKLDPFVLFDELSKLTSKPQKLIIAAFLKKFQPLSFYDNSSYRLYTYDLIKGLDEIDSLQDKENCTDYLKMIVDGYSRIIFCDDYDVTKEYWGLEHKESGFDYKDSFGRYIPYTPFYFKRSDIKSFLEYSEMPLPPCITQETINTTNSSETINYNDDLQQRINQLEQELTEQKKINSESVYIPPLNIADTDNLVSENNQLKIDNQKLIQQLNEANKEIEELDQFIQSNNVTELTEEYLKSRERNNYHSLIGGLLYLLLIDSDKNLNQTAIILSLLEKFQCEPFSKRSLEGIFSKAKTQLLSNHPEITFD